MVRVAEAPSAGGGSLGLASGMRQCSRRARRCQEREGVGRARGRAHAHESSPSRAADRGFEHARPAYQLGHLAAHNPEWAGRSFDDVEPDLRRGWSDDLHARHGAWDAVRPHVRDAWGHARTQGAGTRRDAAVIGSAGSAVDPVELDRAQRGLPSVETRGGELDGR